MLFQNRGQTSYKTWIGSSEKGSPAWTNMRLGLKSMSEPLLQGSEPHIALSRSHWGAWPGPGPERGC